MKESEKEWRRVVLSARTTNETRSANPRLFRRRVPSTFEPCVFNPLRDAQTLSNASSLTLRLFWSSPSSFAGVSMAFEICTTRVSDGLAHEGGWKKKGCLPTWRLICFEGRVLRIFRSLNTFDATILFVLLHWNCLLKKSLYILLNKLNSSNRLFHILIYSTIKFNIIKKDRSIAIHYSLREKKSSSIFFFWYIIQFIFVFVFFFFFFQRISFVFLIYKLSSSFSPL